MGNGKQFKVNQQPSDIFATTLGLVWGASQRLFREQQWGKQRWQGNKLTDISGRAQRRWELLQTVFCFCFLRLIFRANYWAEVWKSEISSSLQNVWQKLCMCRIFQHVILKRWEVAKCSKTSLGKFLLWIPAFVHKMNQRSLITLEKHEALGQSGEFNADHSVTLYFLKLIKDCNVS